MLIKDLFSPRKAKILPKANDKLAKLMVINVKNNVLIFFMYFLISRKIAVFIIIITVNKTANLSTNSILKINCGKT